MAPPRPLYTRRLLLVLLAAALPVLVHAVAGEGALQAALEAVTTTVGEVAAVAAEGALVYGACAAATAAHAACGETTSTAGASS